MTCTRSLLLVLVTGCLNSDTDLSTSTLVETNGNSSSSSDGTGSSSGSGDNTTGGTTGLAACDDDPACGPGEDLEWVRLLLDDAISE